MTFSQNVNVSRRPMVVNKDLKSVYLNYLETEIGQGPQTSHLLTLNVMVMNDQFQISPVQNSINKVVVIICSDLLYIFFSQE